MNISWLISCLVTLVTILGPNFAIAIPISSGGGNINQLTLIGNVEGKFYFVEETTELSWNDAKIFCESNGMQLAAIKSIAQSTLLKSAFNNVTFSGWHWTGARDYGTPLQFLWDHNAEVLNSAVVSPFSAGPRLCVNFNPDDSYFRSAFCDNKNKALCELAA